MQSQPSHYYYCFSTGNRVEEGKDKQTHASHDKAAHTDRSYVHALIMGGCHRLTQEVVGGGGGKGRNGYFSLQPAQCVHVCSVRV